MDSEAGRSWSGVQFQNGGTAVVPVKWYNRREQLLSWPPKTIKLGEELTPSEDWKRYQDVRLLNVCGEVTCSARRKNKVLVTELQEENYVIFLTRKNSVNENFVLSSRGVGLCNSLYCGHIRKQELFLNLPSHLVLKNSQKTASRKSL